MQMKCKCNANEMKCDQMPNKCIILGTIHLKKKPLTHTTCCDTLEFSHRRMGIECTDAASTWQQCQMIPYYMVKKTIKSINESNKQENSTQGIEQHTHTRFFFNRIDI